MRPTSQSITCNLFVADGLYDPHTTVLGKLAKSHKSSQSAALEPSLAPCHTASEIPNLQHTSYKILECQPTILDDLDTAAFVVILHPVILGLKRNALAQPTVRTGESRSP